MEMIVPGPCRPGSADLNPDSAGRSASWSVRGTTAHLTVTDPAALPAARRLVARRFAEAEKAASRLRRDAELHNLYRAGGQAITVSPVRADLVAAALVAAERSDGDVDPTVAAAMTAVHSGRRAGSQDRSGLPAGAAPATSHFDAAEGERPGHLIDPRTGAEPFAIWRSAGATGFTALEAATYTAPR